MDRIFLLLKGTKKDTSVYRKFLKITIQPSIVEEKWDRMESVYMERFIREFDEAG